LAEYLFKSDWIESIRDKNIFLFFDFDGTLVPIQKNPENCYISPDIKNILESIQNKIKIGIISGRDLEDIKRRVLIHGIYYSGSHGLEIERENIKYIHPEAKTIKPLIDRIYRRLIEEMRDFRDVFVEKKAFSFTLHYRRVLPEQRNNLKKLFFRILKDFNQEKIKILKGKMVFEVMPAVDWDKGKAVLFIINYFNKKFFPIFIGDDKTDETVFKAIKNTGLAVRIGHSKNTEAIYYLKNQKEIYKFLSTLKEVFNV